MFVTSFLQVAETGSCHQKTHAVLLSIFSGFVQDKNKSGIKPLCMVSIEVTYHTLLEIFFQHFACASKQLCPPIWITVSTKLNLLLGCRHIFGSSNLSDVETADQPEKISRTNYLSNVWEFEMTRST